VTALTSPKSYAHSRAHSLLSSARTLSGIRCLSPQASFEFPTTSVSDVRRTSVGACGNGVCELGERCDGDTAAVALADGGSGSGGSGCCDVDCPVRVGECPDVDGVTCNAAGACVTGLDGVGVCQCFAGYHGAACGQCDPDMVQSLDGRCLYVPHVPLLPVPSPTPVPCDVAPFLRDRPGPVASLGLAKVYANRVTLAVRVSGAARERCWLCVPTSP
jgi:hypothetical protein